VGDYVIQLVVTDAAGSSSVPATITASTVASPQIFVSQGGVGSLGNNLYTGSVGEYNAASGAVINASFIPGLNAPAGLVLSGNNLFVGQGNNTVGKYNATTGAAINPFFITGLSGNITGVALSGNNLFVASLSGGTVGVYDATTGIALKPNLIPGVAFPFDLALSGNTLFVSQPAVRTVGAFNAASGAPINANFISAPPGSIPFGVAVSGNNLFVAYENSNTVGEYNATTGALINPSFITGLTLPAGIAGAVVDVPPVAAAGPDQAITVIGTVVQLNGSQSYSPGGLPITYQWSFVSKPVGSNASLTGPTTATPSFAADVHGNYSIRLTVTDSFGAASSPAIVNVSFNNVAPVANAGASQSVAVGQTVTLDGSGSSDANGDPLNYKWAFTSVPSGSQAVISNPTAQIASFVPDVAGKFVVQLIANDGFVDSLPSTVQIQAVSQLTQLIQNIQSLQTVIANLTPGAAASASLQNGPGAFKNANMRNALLNKLNAVIASVEAGNYSDALGQLQNDILTKTDGCATIGAPDKNDWITNCPDQSKVYTPLLNIIAEVKALGGG
jgi:hypothetical protein